MDDENRRPVRSRTQPRRLDDFAAAEEMEEAIKVRGHIQHTHARYRL